MAYQGVIALSFFLLTLSFSLSNPSPNPTAFRVDLHHCDSVHSPLHDPSASPYALRKLAVERSISRHNALQWEISGKYSPSDLRTDMKRIPGEYLMKISIGTPPQPFWLSFDTGSDLVWTQCEPCANCFEQDGEKYDPENSCTFVTLEGTAPLCQAYHGGTPPANPCPYTVVYLDQSQSTGILATESFTFETSRTVITGIGFGCGRTNTGNFVPAMAGVAGLGGGPLSLTSQLGGIIAGKYSYCLTLSTATDAMGKLIFGDNPVFDGPNTKRTQILRDPNIPTYHFLGLEGISVGNKRLNIPVGTFDSGRFIIDSGTTLNFLANGGYGPLTDELKDVIQLEAANDPSTDPDIVLELCYKKPNNYEGIPDITYHFSGGADWIMPPQNSFEVASADVICLALRPADEQLQLSIMGNMAQQNMVVEFNVNDNILSFVPADCTAL
ncbi:hypothetical protein AMTRI_Chr01g128290 [Amborella trichopoda]